MGIKMSSAESLPDPVYAKKSQPGPAAKTKKVVKAGNSSVKKSIAVKKPTYSAMITQAITEMNQKKGSSRAAILKHIAWATNTVPKTLLVNKTMKKMVEEGILVHGAQAGKTGSGSFKISPGEKLRLKKAEKVSAKKAAQKAKKVEGTTTAAKTSVNKVAKKAAKEVVKKVPKKVVKKTTAAKKSTGTVKQAVSAKKGSKVKTTAKPKTVVSKSKKVK